MIVRHGFRLRYFVAIVLERVKCKFLEYHLIVQIEQVRLVLV